MYPSFQHKANRDKLYRELLAKGESVRRVTYSNQLTHPMYISDFVGAEKNDTGLGNTVYKTHFSKIYTIEEKRDRSYFRKD